MARRKRVHESRQEPDPRYHNVMITKFINHIMQGGKKSIAQRIVYDAFDIVKAKSGKNPLEVFDQALKNVAPLVEVKGKRIGGANYQIPFEVRGDRKYALAFRWIISAARGRKGRPMAERLAQEFLDAEQKQGIAVKKREDTHRMAEANKAFAHFAY